MKTIKFEYVNKEDNITLIKSLTNILGLNFVDIKKLLRKKDIKVNSKRVSEDIKLNINDIITCFMPFNLDIIYEDENILLVNKPKHIETTSNINLNTIHSQLKQIYSYCEPCNRLDTNTTGINVFALNKESEIEILDAFKDDMVTKKYYAVVSGKVLENDVFEDYLLKDSLNSKVTITKNNVNNAVKIVTEYKKVKQLNLDLCLIEVTLHTGKTHQIRAHLSFHNIYVLGDEKYGSIEINKKYNKHTQFLISYLIAFDFLDGSRLKYISGRNFNLNLDIQNLKI